MEKVPAMEDDTTSVTCAAKPITVKAETKAHAVETTSGCRVMTIKRLKNQKNVNQLFPVRDMEYIRQPRQFPLLVTNFWREPTMLHKQALIAFETEPTGPVVTPRIDDGKGAQKMDETDGTKPLERELMTVSNQNENQEAQVVCHDKVKTNDEN